jgi:hypothetical protein
MVFFATMEEVVGKHIMDAIKLDETKATVMETILKNKSVEERVAGRHVGFAV